MLKPNHFLNVPRKRIAPPEHFSDSTLELMLKPNHFLHVPRKRIAPPEHFSASTLELMLKPNHFLNEPWLPNALPTPAAPPPILLPGYWPLPTAWRYLLAKHVDRCHLATSAFAC